MQGGRLGWNGGRPGGRGEGGGSAYLSRHGSHSFQVVLQGLLVVAVRVQGPLGPSGQALQEVHRVQSSVAAIEKECLRKPREAISANINRLCVYLCVCLCVCLCLCQYSAYMCICLCKSVSMSMCTSASIVCASGRRFCFAKILSCIKTFFHFFHY